jgi:hypothetical protein
MTFALPYNPDSKTYYRPLEAALRWCNLSAHEALILGQSAAASACQLGRCFPQWPCLKANAEKIYDAIHNGELRYGYMGRTVAPGTFVDPVYLTVRHIDLKQWMSDFYPDQKPDFLFDPIERSTHNSITLETFQILKAEHEALVKKIEAKCLECPLNQNRSTSPASTQIFVTDTSSELSPRSELTHLHVIGSLLGLLLGQSPSGIPYSSFRTQAAVISSILVHYPGRLGITQRTLENKFAAARRSLGIDT